MSLYGTQAMFERITSFQNARVKLARALRDKKDREREQRFVIDDGRDLMRALACGYQADYVLFSPRGQNARFGYDVPARQVFEVPEEIMQKASYREHPGDVLAVMHAKPSKGRAALEAELDGAALALVNLQKPGNIGALMRTADASGFKHVLLIDTSLDLYNPNIIRSSTGACFLDNVYTVNSAEALDVLQHKGYWIASAHLQGQTALFDIAFPRKTAVVLGTEDVGLPDEWVAACDALVIIPMAGQISDSLNVSVSGAVIMYEVFRQHLLLGHP